jgi:hypothetical protein
MIRMPCQSRVEAVNRLCAHPRSSKKSIRVCGIALVLACLAPLTVPSTAYADQSNCATFEGNRPSGLSYDSVKNITLCFDGTKIWKNSSGPECNVTTLPPITLQGITWCGVYNDGNSWLEIGVNYNLTSQLGGTIQGYSRFRFDSNGNAVSQYGS